MNTAFVDENSKNYNLRLDRWGNHYKYLDITFIEFEKIYVHPQPNVIEALNNVVSESYLLKSYQKLTGDSLSSAKPSTLNFMAITCS